MARKGISPYPHDIDDVSLRQLRCFLLVAEERQFVGAARRLGIAQPPISRLIRRLERAVGAPLFERTRRGATLTAVGEALVAPARRTLSEARGALAAAREAAAGGRGALSVGFSSSAVFSVLPEILRRYRREYPGVTLLLRELVTAAQIRDVEEGRLDVGVARGPIDAPALEATRLHREPFLAVVPSAHPLARRQAIALRDLARESFVFIPRHVAPDFYDAIVRGCRRAGVTLTVREEVAEWHTVVSLVGAGLGVSMAPASLAKLEHRGVAFRRLTGAPLHADLVLVRRRDATSEIVRGFVRVVGES